MYEGGRFMKIRNLWKACMTLGLGAALVFGGGTVQAAERPAVDCAEAEMRNRVDGEKSTAKEISDDEENTVVNYELDITGKLEQPLTISKTVNRGKSLRFRLTVEEDGWYTFEGRGIVIYSGEIVNAESEQIASDLRFLMDVELHAGTVYYLNVEPGVELYSDDTFTMKVSRNSFAVTEREKFVIIPWDAMGESRTISPGILQVNPDVQLSYQWYVMNMATMEYEIIPDATDREYVLDGVTDKMTFKCVVMDGKVSIDTYVSLDIDSELGVDVESEDVLVKPGGSATLTVHAINPLGRDLTYYWYKWMAEDNTINTEGLEDATGDTVTIQNVSKSIMYACLVSDDYRSATKFFNVMVDSGLSVEHESEYYIIPGEDLELSVTASTVLGNLSYQWYRKDMETGEYEEISGATEDHYACEHIVEVCEYMCRVKDGYNVNEASFSIYMQTDLSVEADTYQKVKFGEKATFEVTASSSYGELTYRWYDDEFDLIKGVTSNKYTIDAAVKNRDYFCVVSDGYDSKTIEFELDVESGLKLIYDDEYSVKYDTGTAILSVEAITESEQVTYQWYDENGDWISGAEESTYPITNVTAETHYSCYVYDGCEEVWADFRVLVDTGLIAYGGRDFLLDKGESVTLNAIGYTEAGAVTYEWYTEDDEYIKQEYDGKLEVNNVNYSQEYYCIVSDGINREYVFFNIYINSGFEAKARRIYFAERGQQVNLKVDAKTFDDSLQYLWEKYDPDSGEYQTIAEESPVCSVTASGNRDVYYCTVSDDYNYKRILITVIPSRNTDTMLREGENKISVTETEKIFYASFVPERTGTYEFISTGRKDTYGYLMDSGFQVLKEDDDSWNENMNFKIRYQLKAGVTYYLGVMYYSFEEAGIMPVKVSYLSEAFECDHPYLTDWIVTQESTCTHGKKQEKRCTVCGEVRLGEEYAIQLGHSFGNWTVITAATAEREGLESRTCTMCGRKETRRIAKLSSYVRLKADNLPLKVKQSFNLTKALEKAKGDTVVSWSSTNPKVAAVNRKGKVVGKKKGTAIITVKMRSGATASVKVKVQKNAVKTKKVKVSKKKITLKKGKSQKIKTEITPLTSQDKVKYSSSNKKVAVVSAKGKITAKKPGKAKITVRSGRKRAVIKVTVR